jgi:hypothetical protein
MRITTRLNKAASAYLEEIQKIADEVRWKFVVPFCRTHNLRFAQANGTYYFFPLDGSPCWQPIYTDNEYVYLQGGEFGETTCRLRGTARVIRALETPIPFYDHAALAYAAGLYSFMKEYSPAKKAKKR